jgi:metal-sulfur cluster biosynthetic enzyme
MYENKRGVSVSEIPLLNRVRASLFEVIDPELGVNIMDLGLIYGVILDTDDNVTVRMTLTTPGCPMSDSIQNGVKYRVSQINGVGEVTIDLVFEPRWSPAKMTERCKKFLWK